MRSLQTVCDKPAISGFWILSLGLGLGLSLSLGLVLGLGLGLGDCSLLGINVPKAILLQPSAVPS